MARLGGLESRIIIGCLTTGPPGSKGILIWMNWQSCEETEGMGPAMHKVEWDYISLFHNESSSEIFEPLFHT